MMRRTLCGMLWAAALLAGMGASGCAMSREALPLTLTRVQTLADVGAAQGVTWHNGFFYVYGDAETGVIREYALEVTPHPRLVATGRAILLTMAGEDVASHPTGLTFHPLHGCFLGDTVRRKGRIFHIDFDAALERGTLDGAVLNVVEDDAAVNGTRPEFVELGGRWWIATSDYGPGPNYVRYYDPERLKRAVRTTDPGLEVRRVPCGPWVQTLHYRREVGELVLVQNQIEGLRWRLTVVTDLNAPDYREARVIDLTNPADELEGFVSVRGYLGVFVSAMRRDNLVISISGERGRRQHRTGRDEAARSLE